MLWYSLSGREFPRNLSAISFRVESSLKSDDKFSFIYRSHSGDIGTTGASNTFMSSIFDLTGKIALVTGASSGIGRHFANTLAGYGANVILAARRSDRLEQAVDEIQESGSSASWVKLDVTDQNSVEQAFSDAIERYGRIDIVINNAGVASAGKALDVTEQHWDDVIATNLKGAWLVGTAGRIMHVRRRQGWVPDQYRIDSGDTCHGWCRTFMQRQKPAWII